MTRNVSQYHRGATIVLSIDNDTGLRDYSADIGVQPHDQNYRPERLHVTVEGSRQYPRRAL